MGCQWPPSGVVPLSYLGTPLLNTIILLRSGATVTLSHVLLRRGGFKPGLYLLLSTVILGVLFTGLQVKEYIECSFRVADSVYGRAFFLITGFHGAHVLIGTRFLIIQIIRFILFQFRRFHHLGFDAAI